VHKWHTLCNMQSIFQPRQTTPSDLMLHPINQIIPHLPLNHCHFSYSSVSCDITISAIYGTNWVSKIAHSTPQKGRSPCWTKSAHAQKRKIHVSGQISIRNHNNNPVIQQKRNWNQMGTSMGLRFQNLKS
jgi:hypothetical protein